MDQMWIFKYNTVINWQRKYWCQAGSLNTLWTYFGRTISCSYFLIKKISKREVISPLQTMQAWISYSIQSLELLGQVFNDTHVHNYSIQTGLLVICEVKNIKHTENQSYYIGDCEWYWPWIGIPQLSYESVPPLMKMENLNAFLRNYQYIYCYKIRACAPSGLTFLFSNPYSNQLIFPSIILP